MAYRSENLQAVSERSDCEEAEKQNLNRVKTTTRSSTFHDFGNHPGFRNVILATMKVLKKLALREESPKVAQETPENGDLSLSGNELADRVEPTPVHTKKLQQGLLLANTLVLEETG
ncbi:unnamed protein product [Caenorhabditis angaria]|uniref:Uncharacterized protein n=1 Tax=Caenorhabditis angaria TaxID=860376 RepID=A0A9P1IT83_9PELO|nr:unnamed protein product [Caenorhabditis angaria]